jgi:hypothetical protein
MAIKYINIFKAKGPPKFTQIGIFDLKTNHLATLHSTYIGVCLALERYI